MKTILLLAPCVVAAGLLLGGCVVDDDDDVYGERRVYGRGGEVDFYYTSGRPYSRAYGPLVVRDGRYYYSRGGSYVVYDRPTTVVRSDARVVHRDVDVRHRDVGVRSYGGVRRVEVDDDDDDDRDDDMRVRRTRVYRDDGIRSETGTRVRVIER